MNYQLRISPIFTFILGLIFFGVMGFTQANNAIPTAQSKSENHAVKTSSNNIHIDDIAIKISPDTQSVNSDEDHKRLVSKLSDDAKEEVINWIKRQWWLTDIFGIAVIVSVILSIWATIKISVQLAVDKKVSSLDKKREESIEATIKVTHEIERTQKALGDLQDIEKELNKKLKDFRREIDAEVKNTNSIKIDVGSITRNFESKIKDEISEREKKSKVIRLIINKIDNNGLSENRVIDELILNLNSDDKEIKYTATELLPYFERESNKITDAFVETLKNNSDTTLELLLLIGLSKLKCDSNKNLDYLINAVDDLSNSNILAIIGALGNLGEIGKLSEIDKTKKLESIIDKLLSILSNDLDSNEFSSGITASKVKGAIALALSCSGFEAVVSKAVVPLISLLADEDQETRKNAAIALGTIEAKAKDAIPALRRLENDEHAEVRGAASESIEKIQQNA